MGKQDWLFWCCQDKRDVNSKAKAAQPLVGVQGKWEQLLAPAAPCFPFCLSCGTLADIKVSRTAHQSLPLVKENKSYPNEAEGDICLFFYFKNLVCCGLHTTLTLACGARTPLTFGGLEHTHAAWISTKHNHISVDLYFTSCTPACHVWSPCLPKESTLGTGHTCFIYKTLEPYGKTECLFIKCIWDLSFCFNNQCAKPCNLLQLLARP